MSAYRYFFNVHWSGRPNNPRAFHVWFGPLGFHVFWPVWKSEIEWMSHWKENLP